MVRQVFAELSRKKVLTEHADIFTARTMDTSWQWLEGPLPGKTTGDIGRRNW